MSKLVWDDLLSQLVTTGVDKGVLYSSDGTVHVWNGLIAVTEKADNAELAEFYYDGQKYTNLRTPESFQATVEAYTYPWEFNGRNFGLTYRVNLDKGYELHLVYNASAVPSDESHTTLADNVDAITFSWDIWTIPEQIDSKRAAAHFVINSANTYPNVLSALEDLLYGTFSLDPRFPSVAEVIAIFELGAVFRVIDNGDGTWTATGPDSWFEQVDPTTFRITTPSVETLDDNSYQIRSW